MQEIQKKWEFAHKQAKKIASKKPGKQKSKQIVLFCKAAREALSGGKK